MSPEDIVSEGGVNLVASRQNRRKDKDALLVELRKKFNLPSDTSESEDTDMESESDSSRSSTSESEDESESISEPAPKPKPNLRRKPVVNFMQFDVLLYMRR